MYLINTFLCFQSSMWTWIYFFFIFSYIHTQLWMRGIDWSTSACVLIHLARLVAYMFFCAPMPPPPPHLFNRSSFLNDWSFLSCTKTFIRSLCLYLCRFSFSLRNNKTKKFSIQFAYKTANNREWIIRKISPSRFSSN